jgi:hypothetical protein
VTFAAAAFYGEEILSAEYGEKSVVGFRFKHDFYFVEYDRYLHDFPPAE